MSAVEAPSWRPDLLKAGGRLAATMWGGLASGAVVGGIGGRLAMFVLRLTSDPSLHGMKTDDGFIIGRFSPDTLFLIVFSALLGALSALFYLAIRLWLPERSRPSVMALLGAAIGGALFIRPGGLDFTALDPLPLAVAMFIALPALHGFMMSVIVERLLLRPPQRFIATFLALLIPLAAVLLLGIFGLFVLLLLGLGWVLNRKMRFTDDWDRQPVAWLGRAVILGGGALSLVTLVGDIADVF